MKEAKLVNALSKSIPELCLEVWGVRKNKKLAASNAPSLWVKEQAQLEIVAKENKHSVCSKKKSQSAIKESQQLSQMLRAMKGNQHQGVEKVTVTENGIAREYRDMHSMETVLFTEGHHHFSQTQFESPMDGSLTNAIGFWDQCQGACEILQGAFDASKTLDNHMHLLLKALWMPQ